MARQDEGGLGDPKETLSTTAAAYIFLKSLDQARWNNPYIGGIAEILHGITTMPTFRCEFAITGDLVLAQNAAELVLNGTNKLAVTLKNGPINEEGQVVGLLASVVGHSPSLGDAQEELRRALGEQLDLLAFATHSRFKIVRPLRLIEWEPGQGKRRFQLFHTRDARDPPDPELGVEYLETVAALDGAKPPAFARTALKYFRYGLLDDQPEDQLMRLWLALEVVAENLNCKLLGEQ